MEVLSGALDAPREEVPSYLDRACGQDARLRREVESLLARDVDLPSLLATQGPSAVLDLLSNLPGTLGPGDRVDRFEIVRTIGEGGMGIVFLARELQPVRREVALKLMKPGLDTRKLITRFEAERQTLALLDHWNIARLHHAGATHQGQPYFVMEYVDGERITEFANGRELTIRERSQLLIPVCRAIHHAHQKGVVHRDLKPSNVLVAGADSGPVPKIIDFGVAKLTQDPLEFGTLTEVGRLLGTPEYMSPEQADPAATDIDTATDIYALGVLLYELLTGRVPFERSGEKDTVQALLKRVREESPLPPSVRLSRSGQTPTVPIRAKGASADDLARQVRGELDWIVLRTLEKERERRYASAAELASDLERYLRNEPILARPPSTTYQIRKVVSRHRYAFSAAAAVLALAVGAAVVMTILWQGQRLERERSGRMNRYLTRVLGSTTSRVVLDEAVRHIEPELGSDPRTRSDVATLLGGAYRNLDLFEEAQSLFESALEVAADDRTGPELERAYRLMDLGGVLAAVSDYEGAEARFEEAVEILVREQGEFAPATTAARLAHANVVTARGAIDRSRRLFRSLAQQHANLDTDDQVFVARSLLELADVYRAKGEAAASDSLFREGTTRLESVGLGEGPEVGSALHRWAEMAFYDQANPGRAIELATRAVELYSRLSPRSGMHALTLGRLGLYQIAAGDDDGAEIQLMESLDIWRERSRETSLAAGPTLLALADIATRQERVEEAREYLETCRGTEWFQQTPRLRFALWVENFYGWSLVGEGRLAEAETILLRTYDELVREHALDPDQEQTLRRRLSVLYERWGREEDARLYRLPTRSSVGSFGGSTAP